MRIKKKLFSLLLVFSFLVSFLIPGSNVQAADSNQLKVHFINVGQADAILVQQGSSTMLVDGGNNEDGQLVKNYITNLGINKIDVMVGTHAHEDHIGGLDYVINAMQVGKIYFPKQTSTTKTFQDFVNVAKSKGLTFNVPVVGQTFRVGNATVTVLAPNGANYEDGNDYSIVLKVQYGSNSFLLTGDAEAVSEKEMLAKGLNLKADVLKISHHGSKSSTTDAFLSKVNPKYAVISVGKDNSYGHPTSEVLNRLKSKGIATYRTDLQGTIIATSNGTNITFNTNPATGGGTVKNGWLLENGKWYYYSNNTAKTGWLQDKGTWYYLKSDGAMATGWQQVGSTWYYLEKSGAMKTGWLSIGGTWYYLKDSGAMATGWLLVNNSWYYLAKSGDMKTGWLSLDSEWYYLKDSGVMATGWIQYGSNWYYLYSSGKMARNTTIEGYKLGADGAWIVQSETSGGGNSGGGSTISEKVYWTPTGKSYHSRTSCPTLARSKTIYSGYLSNCPKSDPCNVCVH